MTAKDKFTSPSTPTVKHDVFNLIVEAILINRHGSLPEGSWRKNQPHNKEWGRLLTCVRRITKSLGVDAEQLAWFIKFYKITNLEYKDFGLLRWKVKKYFKWCNLGKFSDYYVHVQEQAKSKESSYVNNTEGYKTKAPNAKKAKTLSEILKELEDNEQED